MNLRSHAVQVARAASVACALLPARVTVARPCASEGDCPRGFMCLPSGVALADGGFEGACVSVSCASDSDCGSGTRCEQNLGTRCVIAADGGQSCEPASACVPAWQAPCTSDAECGPGFTCTNNTTETACGPDQTAQVPAYATATTIACEDAPRPPLLPRCGRDAGTRLPCVPSLCDAGASCLSIKWKTCEAHAPSTCALDGDCPATWSCACPAAVRDFGPFVGDASAAACTKTCIAPNSDLLGDTFGNGLLAPDSIADAGVVYRFDAGASRAAAAAQTARQHHGCSVAAAPSGGLAPSSSAVALLAFALGARCARGFRRRTAVH